MFMKLGRDEVLMVTHLCLGFSANSAQGWIQGGSIIGQWGVPSPKDFFFRLECYSNKPNAWQLSKSIWEEALLFLVPFWSQIFDFFLNYVILVYLNPISIDLYVVKCFICIFFCNCQVYKLEYAYIEYLLYAWKKLIFYVFI